MMKACWGAILLWAPVSVAYDSFRISAHRHGLVSGAGAHFRSEPRKAARTSKLKAEYPWYHSSDELHAEVKRLSDNCNSSLSYRTRNDSGVSISVARIRRPGADPKNRVFILFGEHSRELISPESGLYFMRVLCGDVPATDASASSVLQDSEFEIVLNGNPRSRLKVEEGDYCLRTNPDGVDLNRNWDEKWTPRETDVAASSPGPRPFSEPETRIFKDLVNDFKPTTFLTVHSGTRGVYMPWAYDTSHLGTRNQQSMLNILRDIDQRHCQCPYGAAGKEVGYSCPGTCLDWVYDKLRVPYVFAFEIYTSPDYDSALKKRWEEKASSGQALLQSGAGLGHEHFADLFRKHASDFVHVSGANHTSGTDAFACFEQFNPHTGELYQKTVANWAGAYLDMSRQVAAEIRKKGLPKPGGSS